MYRKLIVYDRNTRDFAIHLNGDLVGYAATYLQAEAALNTLVYELLSKAPAPAADVPTTTDQRDYEAQAS